MTQRGGDPFTSTAPAARFDDARARTSTVLSGFVEELRAERLDDVRPLLMRVADEARRGRFVAGYLTYECAPAFDDALVVSSAPS
ncbi:MAG: hypothetical protein ACRDV0_00430, partial [Acidimicrobiales bacterium]